MGCQVSLRLSLMLPSAKIPCFLGKTMELLPTSAASRFSSATCCSTQTQVLGPWGKSITMYQTVNSPKKQHTEKLVEGTNQPDCLRSRFARSLSTRSERDFTHSQVDFTMTWSWLCQGIGFNSSVTSLERSQFPPWKTWSLSCCAFDKEAFDLNGNVTIFDVIKHDQTTCFRAHI